MNVDLSLPDVTIHSRGRGRGGSQIGLADLGQRILSELNTNTKFRQFQRLYRDDRLAFAHDCVTGLKHTIAPYQEEILGLFDEGHRRVAVRAPHGSGKSMLAALLVHHTLLTTEEDTTVPTLASVWRQLERYLWPEIHKLATLLSWYDIGREPYGRDELMTLSMRTNGGLNESFAVASGDAALIEGAHASRLFYIFDESKSIDTTMWDAAEGAFSTEGTSILGREGISECYWFAISTPGLPAGRFHDIHMAKEGYDDWVRKHITIEQAIAAGRVGKDWVDQRAKQWGVNSAVYKNRVLAEFASDGSDGVIPSDWVSLAFERYEDWVDGGRLGAGLGNRILGVDTARYGSDTTVFADRVNMTLEALHVYEYQSVPNTAGYLKPLARQASAVRIEMDSGLGASVYDILDSEQSAWDRTMNLIPITMGAGYGGLDPTDTFRFANVRAASWWNMRVMLDPDGPYAGQVRLMPDEELMGDLTAPRYEIKYQHAQLTIVVEPKENIKRSDRLGRSPDKGDAVVLAFWDDGADAGAQGLVI